MNVMKECLGMRLKFESLIISISLFKNFFIHNSSTNSA